MLSNISIEVFTTWTCLRISSHSKGLFLHGLDFNVEPLHFCLQLFSHRRFAELLAHLPLVVREGSTFCFQYGGLNLETAQMCWIVPLTVWMYLRLEWVIARLATVWPFFAINLNATRMQVDLMVERFWAVTAKSGKFDSNSCLSRQTCFSSCFAIVDFVS